MNSPKRPVLVSRSQVMATLGLGALLYALLCWPVRGFVADDTFIHLTYAKHVRDGQGLVFNPGERVYGTTSPLWSLGLGFLGRTGIDLLLLARALSILLGLATIGAGGWALLRLLATVRDRHGLNPDLARLAWTMGTLALAADVWLIRWSASGMETALGVFLVTLGFAFDWDATSDHGRGAAVCWALAGLIRPEAFILVGLLAARAALAPATAAERLRGVTAALLPAVVLGAGWCVYAAQFYGTIVPATFASKAAEHWGPLSNLVIEAQGLAADRGVEIAALVVSLPVLAQWLRRDWPEHFIGLSWLLALPLFYVATQVQGIPRYLLLLLPVLIGYGWTTLAALASRWEVGRPSRWPRVALLAAGLSAVGGNLFVLGRWVVPQARGFERILDRSLIPMATWFNQHTPPGTRIAIPHVGVFGYYADRRIVDLCGLVTPEMAPLLARYQYDRMVTELRFAERVRPEYLIDVDTESRRMLSLSPYAACLTLLDEKPFDYRSIRHPEMAYATVYRIEWACYDSHPRPPD